MKTMTTQERLKRIIARGEFSGHCHVITGDVIIEEKNNKLYVTVTEDSNASLKHLLEKNWMEGIEVWTKEHTDIELEPGLYEFVQQKTFDPLLKRIQNAID